MLRFKIFSSICALGGLKEENTGVGMRWYSFNSPITTANILANSTTIKGSVRE